MKFIKMLLKKSLKKYKCASQNCGMMGAKRYYGIMEKYTYKNSGVDLNSAETLSKLLFTGLKSANFKSFAGLFEHPALPEYALAATTDGIGTKIIPLIEKGLYKTMAADLAAMNLNDLACVGARPLFFLDYIAVNSLDARMIAHFVQELNFLLLSHGCALLGGETSELGNFIKEGHFDAAGFAVGLVKKTNLMLKENIEAGDVVIGLKSSGAHSNGFSLIRKLYADKKITKEEFLKTLKPTEIYVDEILELCDRKLILGAANITGGGILSNLERTIPDGLTAVLNKNMLPKLEVFEILNKYVCEDEMFRTFNMGAGFCVVTKPENVSEILNVTKKYSPFVFGTIKKAEGNEKAVFGE